MRRSSFAGALAALALSTTLAACGGTHSVTITHSNTATAGASAVNTLLARGIAQADANRLSEAATTFGDVLAVSPTNKFALYNLGVIAQDRRDPSGAVARYDQALNADSTYTPAMYNKALILETGDPSASLALYRRIVQLNPEASTAYLRMAIVYTRQHMPTQAKQARARAIALDPSLANYRIPNTCTTASC